MRKHKHFKVKDFLNFSYEEEIHEVPKNIEKVGFPSTGKA